MPEHSIEFSQQYLNSNLDKMFSNSLLAVGCKL